MDCFSLEIAIETMLVLNEEIKTDKMESRKLNWEKKKKKVQKIRKVNKKKIKNRMAWIESFLSYTNAI